MNIRAILERENNKKTVLKIVDYVGNNYTRFKVLVDVFLAGPYRITQRAVWPLTYCVENHPGLILPHLKDLLNTLQKPGANDTVKRNVIRMFQFIELPQSLEGRVADICFTYLCDKKEAIAIRVFSMTVLANISIRNPELKNELKIIIEDELPYSRAAFRARGSKILKQFS